MATYDNTPNSKNFYVYFLIDPRIEKVFYVGQTRDWNERYKTHVDRFKVEWEIKRDGDSKLRAFYVQEMLNQNILPAMYVREQLNSRYFALLRERAWMLYFAEQGIKLTNVALMKIEGLKDNEHPADNYAKVERIRIDKRYDEPIDPEKGKGKLTREEIINISLDSKHLTVEQIARKYKRPEWLIENLLSGEYRKKRRKE